MLIALKMWLDQMPSFGPSKRPHISIKIQRSMINESQYMVLVPPRVLKLHVIQTNAKDPVSNSLLVPSSNDERIHYSWAAFPEHILATDEDADMSGQFLTIRGSDSFDAPSFEVCAWNGPSWAGTDIEYEAFVQFEGDLVLRSGKQKMLIVC